MPWLLMTADTMVRCLGPRFQFFARRIARSITMLASTFYVATTFSNILLSSDCNAIWNKLSFASTHLCFCLLSTLSFCPLSEVFSEESPFKGGRGRARREKKQKKGGGGGYDSGLRTVRRAGEMYLNRTKKAWDAWFGSAS